MAISAGLGSLLQGGFGFLGNLGSSFSNRNLRKSQEQLQGEQLLGLRAGRQQGSALFPLQLQGLQQQLTAGDEARQRRASLDPAAREAIAKLLQRLQGIDPTTQTPQQALRQDIQSGSRTSPRLNTGSIFPLGPR